MNRLSCMLLVCIFLGIVADRFSTPAISLSPKQVVLLVVIDTGANLESESLQTVFWENEKEAPPFNGKDDDGNGYVDDYIGFDAIQNYGSGKGLAGHGTAVCSIAAGLSDNIERLPPDIERFVRIVPIRSFNDEKIGDTYSIVRGLNYALSLQEDTGLKMVINISWAFYEKNSDGQPVDAYNQDIYNMLETARNRGILVVAAVGNDQGKTPRYPAAYGLDNIISVSATDGAHLADYSNILGDIAADGKVVLNKGATVDNGTSYAAPRVSLVAAGVLAYNRQWGYQDVIQRVLKSADHVDDLESKVKNKRKLNPQKAFAMK